MEPGREEGEPPRKARTHLTLSPSLYLSLCSSLECAFGVWGLWRWQSCPSGYVHTYTSIRHLQSSATLLSKSSFFCVRLC